MSARQIWPSQCHRSAGDCVCAWSTRLDWPVLSWPSWPPANWPQRPRASVAARCCSPSGEQRRGGDLSEQGGEVEGRAGMVCGERRAAAQRTERGAEAIGWERRQRHSRGVTHRNSERMQTGRLVFAVASAGCLSSSFAIPSSSVCFPFLFGLRPRKCAQSTSYTHHPHPHSHCPALRCTLHRANTFARPPAADVGSLTDDRPTAASAASGSLSRTELCSSPWV